MVNAAPLSLQRKTGNLDLLAALADTVVVPQAVANQVGAKPEVADVLAELAGNPAYRVANSERLRVNPCLLRTPLAAPGCVAGLRSHGAAPNNDPTLRLTEPAEPVTLAPGGKPWF